MDVLKLENLEHVLQSHWAEFLDAGAVLRVISHHLKDTEIKTLVQDEIPKRHNQLTVSSFKIQNSRDRKEGEWFEVTVEFSMVKGEGVVVGTAIFEMELDGWFGLIKSEFRATHLCPRKS